jgi:hypothetical protein
MKSIKALEEISAVRKSLPLHLSQSFPANNDDAEWELLYPWVTIQRHQLATVLDFMVLGIARSLAIAGNENDRPSYRVMATEAARRILKGFTSSAPRIQKLLWSSSASAVASGIFLALEYILSQDSQTPRTIEYLHELLPLVQSTMDILDRNSPVTIHAEKGVGILRHLWTVCQQWPLGTGGHSVQTILSQFLRNRNNSIGTDLDHANFVFPDMLTDMTSDATGLMFGGEVFLDSDLEATLSMYDIAMS